MRGLLILIAIASLIGLSQQQLLVVGMVAAFFSLVTLENRKFLLGFSLPILPVFGAETIPAILLLHILFFRKFSLDRSWLNRSAPFLSVVLVHAISQIVTGWQSTEFLWFAEKALPKNAAEYSFWLPSSAPVWFSSFRRALLWIVLIVFAAHSSKTSSENQNIRLGLVWGFTLSSLSVVLQWLFPVFSSILAENSFWSGVGRESATFTDPNAFGVFSLLLLPLAFQFRSRLRYVLALFWLSASLASGSRTLILGVVLYAAIFLWQRSRRAFACGVGVSILGAALLVAAPREYHEHLPASLKRTVQTISLSAEGDSSFNSRLKFSRLNFEVWKESPLLGIGLGQFRVQMPRYARGLELSTGVWSDNSNNFYLGILSELGLLGLFGLGLLLNGARFDHSVFRGQSASVWVLAIILLTGPHLDFYEVSALVALILGSTLELSTIKVSRFLTSIFVVAAPLIALGSLRLERGYYAWEKGENGYLRWSSSSSQSVLDCTAGESASLKLRAVNPDIYSKPLLVGVSTACQDQSLKFSSTELRTVELDCSCISSSGLSNTAIYYQLDISRVWQPGGADRRLLGLQEVWKEIPAR